MQDRLKFWMWEICIWVLAVLLIWQVGELLGNLFSKDAVGVEHLVATESMGMVGVLDVGETEDLNGQGASQESWLLSEDSLVEQGDFRLPNFDKIRVVLTNKETGSIYHEEVTYSEAVICVAETDETTAGENAYAGELLGKYNHPDYRGTLEIWETEQGYVIINELPVEEYLYSVVPSEMPSDYPLEALKAQAICARTYAYLHILSPGYPQWNAHVDDTTAFQVYHSVPEQESTNRAVKETQGMVLVAPDGKNLAQTYYYSTSCGYGSDAHVWRTKYSDSYPYIVPRHINRDAVAVMASGALQSVEETVPAMSYDVGRYSLDETAFTTYIKSVNNADYEAQESWYRWSYEVEKVDTERMFKVLQKRYKANPELVLTLQGSRYVSLPIEELDVLVDLKIESREVGGVADELLIITEKNVYKVITELNIRYVLNDGVTQVVRQDGSEVTMSGLLPSAFIVLENHYHKGEVTGYEISGGGFGHGAGMSQNAAKAMAQEGMSAEEILTFFFEDCTLEEK